MAAAAIGRLHRGWAKPRHPGSSPSGPPAGRPDGPERERHRTTRPMPTRPARRAGSQVACDRDGSASRARPGDRVPSPPHPPADHPGTEPAQAGPPDRWLRRRARPRSAGRTPRSCRTASPPRRSRRPSRRTTQADGGARAGGRSTRGRGRGGSAGGRAVADVTHGVIATRTAVVRTLLDDARLHRCLLVFFRMRAPSHRVRNAGTREHPRGQWTVFWSICPERRRKPVTPGMAGSIVMITRRTRGHRSAGGREEAWMAPGAIVHAPIRASVPPVPTGAVGPGRPPVWRPRWRRTSSLRAAQASTDRPCGLCSSPGRPCRSSSVGSSPGGGARTAGSAR